MYLISNSCSRGVERASALVLNGQFVTHRKNSSLFTNQNLGSQYPSFLPNTKPSPLPYPLFPSVLPLRPGVPLGAQALCGGGGRPSAQEQQADDRHQLPGGPLCGSVLLSTLGKWWGGREGHTRREGGREGGKGPSFSFSGTQLSSDMSFSPVKTKRHQ